ncbi:hypothetical protein ISCGN_022687 [Ixodes scapularis]
MNNHYATLQCFPEFVAHARDLFFSGGVPSTQCTIAVPAKYARSRCFLCKCRFCTAHRCSLRSALNCANSLQSRLCQHLETVHITERTARGQLIASPKGN